MDCCGNQINKKGEKQDKMQGTHRKAGTNWAGVAAIALIVVLAAGILLPLLR